MTILELIFVAIILFVNISIGLAFLSIMFSSSQGAPFVPSNKKSIQKMLELAQIKPTDTVFDLGCGDGRIVFALEKMGVKRAIGIEVSPLIYLLARLRKFLSGARRSEIRFGNIFKQTDYAQADVILVFLFPHIVQRIFDEIWPQLKPGARLVSSSFFPKNIEPDVVIPREKGRNKIAVYIKKA